MRVKEERYVEKAQQWKGKEKAGRSQTQITQDIARQVGDQTETFGRTSENMMSENQKRHTFILWDEREKKDTEVRHK